MKRRKKTQKNGSDGSELDQPGRGNIFERFARVTAEKSGSAWAFLIALAVIVVWAVTGPLFDYSDTWQLVINTSTTIVTFLMVFLIQHTQNKDTAALQLKLDELIRSTEGAHNALMNLEALSEEEICKIQERYHELAEAAREGMRQGRKDTNKPEVGETFDIG
jgi:low affinity Fe/Cu permease